MNKRKREQDTEAAIANFTKHFKYDYEEADKRKRYKLENLINLEPQFAVFEETPELSLQDEEQWSLETFEFEEYPEELKDQIKCTLPNEKKILNKVESFTNLSKLN
eukprot:gene6644-10809_t